MTSNSVALPRMKKIPRPPKALIWKAIECLCWAIWAVLCVLGISVHHQYWEAFFVLLYAKWMVRDYRRLIELVEAWLDERPVKREHVQRWLIIWTFVAAPLTLASYLIRH